MHKEKKSSVEESATGFTKTREAARLRQSTVAAVAHVHHQQRADAVVVRCLPRGAPHVGVPDKSSSVDASSLAVDPAKERARDTSRTSTRDMKLPLVRVVVGSEAELEQVGLRFDQKH